MKDNLSGRIIKELRPKMYSYVTGHVCVEMCHLMENQVWGWQKVSGK